MPLARPCAAVGPELDRRPLSFHTWPPLALLTVFFFGHVHGGVLCSLSIMHVSSEMQAVSMRIFPPFSPSPPPRMAGSAWPPACWQASRRGGARRARKSPMTIVPLSVGACSFWYRLLRPCSPYALPSIGVPGSISAPSTGGFFFCRPCAVAPLRRSRGGYNTACEKLTWHSAARGHSVRFGQACSRTRHCLGQHD